MAAETSEASGIRCVWEWIEFLGAMIVTAGFVVVLSPLLAYVILTGIRKDRRTRRRLAREGRLLAWDVARGRVLAQEGILVVELLPKGYRHTWWIDSRRLAEHPECPLPEFREPRTRELYEKFFSPPVHDWCEQHLSALLETAFRVEFPRRTWVDDTLPPERVRVAWG